MRLHAGKKGGFQAAFFLAVWLAFPVARTCLASPPDAVPGLVETLQRRAVAERDAEAPLWQALLHLDHGQPAIRDRGFILSLDRFSPARELSATIAYLYSGDDTHVCRFPARYLWLRATLQAPPLPLGACAELNEFKQRAPADHIALVFASENVSQPSSMMGHLFLKLSGVNRDGEPVAHAISFFTDAATINFPKLMWDSMVIGKVGYFALAPYEDVERAYVGREQRNLWEYELELTPFQRDLIQAHLIELKHTRITYFFQKYNCATLVLHIVALASPRILDAPRLWVTPKAVVRLAERAHLIRRTATRPSDRWIVRLLNASLPASQSRTVKSAVEARSTSFLPSSAVGEQGLKQLELANAYNNYLHAQGRIGDQDWRRYGNRLADARGRLYPNTYLEVGEREDPARSAPDTQASIGVRRIHGESFIQLSFLPVSHALSDDNRQYFGENELEVFDVSVLKDVDSSRVRLDRLIVYSAESLLPRDPITGGVSGRFRIGLEPQIDKTLHRRHALCVEGALGVTTRVTPDIDLYGLVGLGMGLKSGVYLYPSLEIGSVVREVYDMKSLLSIARVRNQAASGVYLYTLALSQSMYLSRSWTLTARFEHELTRSVDDVQFGLQVKRLF